MVRYRGQLDSQYIDGKLGFGLFTRSKKERQTASLSTANKATLHRSRISQNITSAEKKTFKSAFFTEENLFCDTSGLFKLLNYKQNFLNISEVNAQRKKTKKMWYDDSFCSHFVIKPKFRDVMLRRR